MSFLGRAFSRFETKADASEAIFAALLGGRTSKAGVVVNIDRALHVTTVLAVTRVLAEGLAQLPLKLFREDAKGKKELATKHPLYTKLWRRPNDWQTSFEWRETMMFHAALAKGGFSWVPRSVGPDRKVLEILPLQPGTVRPTQSPTWEVAYEVQQADGGTKTLARDQVMHLRGPSWNSYAGLEMVDQAREAIGLAIATEESQSRFHANGTRPSGVLSTEKSLDPKDKDKIKKNIAEGYASLANDYKTLVLDAGWTWTQISASPVDSQTLQSRNLQVEEICRAWRVFPQMIGYSDKTATFASAEAFFLAHVIHSLGPWIERYEQVISRDLLTPDEVEAGYFAKFIVNGLLRGDVKARAEFLASGIINGWLTRNEARETEDLNPLDDLDKPLMPLNMTPVGAATAQGAGVDQKTLAKAIAENLGAPGLEEKIGRVLSAQNEGKLEQARDLINEVLEQVAGAADE